MLLYRILNQSANHSPAHSQFLLLHLHPCPQNDISVPESDVFEIASSKGFVYIYELTVRFIHMVQLHGHSVSKKKKTKKPSNKNRNVTPNLTVAPRWRVRPAGLGTVPGAAGTALRRPWHFGLRKTRVCIFPSRCSRAGHRT